MKKVLLISLILVLGSLITASIRSFCGMEVRSELLGEFGGIVFTVMYMVWGAMFAGITSHIFYPRKTQRVTRYMIQDAGLN